jgi:adenosylcobinamide-GDP ribazoletransferase
MREPSIGAFGAVAIALDLIVKIAALGVLLSEHRAIWSLVAVAAIARAAPLPAGATTRYAHETPGSGTIVADGVSLKRAAAAVVVALAIAGVALRAVAFWPVAVAAVATLIWTAICRKRFGGVTGDTLGANVEMCETLGLAVLTAFR